MVRPTFKVAAISAASLLYIKPDPTTDPVSWIAKAEKKPNWISVKLNKLPTMGNTIRATAFIKKIIKMANEIWFGLAFIIDEIARAAEAPQIEVAAEIRYTYFLSNLNNLPSNKPNKKVKITNMLIMGK